MAQQHECTSGKIRQQMVANNRSPIPSTKIPRRQQSQRNHPSRKKPNDREDDGQKIQRPNGCKAMWAARHRKYETNAKAKADIQQRAKSRTIGNR